MQSERKPLHPFLPQLQKMLESKGNQLDDNENQLLIAQIKKLTPTEQQLALDLIIPLEKSMDQGNTLADVKSASPRVEKNVALTGQQYYIMACLYGYSPNPDPGRAIHYFQKAANQDFLNAKLLFVNQIKKILSGKITQLDDQEERLLIERIKQFHIFPFAEQNQILQLIQLLENKIDITDPLAEQNKILDLSQLPENKDTSNNEKVTGLQHHLLALFYEHGKNFNDLKKANQLYEKAEALDCPNSHWLKKLLTLQTDQLTDIQDDIFVDKLAKLDDAALNRCMKIITPFEEKITKTDHHQITGLQYYILARLYSIFDYTDDPKFEKIQTYLRRASHFNFANAINFLADCYKTRKFGFEKDLNRAMDCYQRAAALGSIDSMHRKAYLFFGKKELFKDFSEYVFEGTDEVSEEGVEKRMLMFQISADRGSAPACFDLATAYQYKYHQTHSDLDKEKLFEYYRKAAYLYRERYLAGIKEDSIKFLKAIVERVPRDPATHWYANTVFQPRTDLESLYKMFEKGKQDELTQIILDDLDSSSIEIRKRALVVLKGLIDQDIRPLNKYPYLVQAAADLTMQYFYEESYANAAKYFTYLMTDLLKSHDQLITKLPVLYPQQYYELGYYLDQVFKNSSSAANFKNGIASAVTGRFTFQHLQFDTLSQLFLMKAAESNHVEARVYLIYQLIDKLRANNLITTDSFCQPREYLKEIGIEDVFKPAEVILLQLPTANFDNPDYIKNLQEISKLDNYSPILISRNGCFFLYNSHGTQWKLTSLDTKLFKTIDFPTDKNDPFFKKLNDFTDQQLQTILNNHDILADRFLQFHESLKTANQVKEKKVTSEVKDNENKSAHTELSLFQPPDKSPPLDLLKNWRNDFNKIWETVKIPEDKKIQHQIDTIKALLSPLGLDQEVDSDHKNRIYNALAKLAIDEARPAIDKLQRQILGSMTQARMPNRKT